MIIPMRSTRKRFVHVLPGISRPTKYGWRDRDTGLLSLSLKRVLVVSKAGAKKFAKRTCAPRPASSSRLLGKSDRPISGGEGGRGEQTGCSVTPSRYGMVGPPLSLS